MENSFPELPGFVHPITVDDAAIFVTGVRCGGFKPKENIYLDLSSGNEELLDSDTVFYNLQNNALYCYEKNERSRIKFRRSPFFQVMERLEENEEAFYLTPGDK